MQQKNLLLAVLSGVTLSLSFPNFNLWPFAWFAFVPFFFALENQPPWRAFLLAYLTGIIFFAGTIYWLSEVTFLGTLLLVFYLAGYFAIFGLLISCQFPLNLSLSLITLPALWAILEYLRSQLFSGFGWALLGYSQCLNLPLIQLADITGVYGISFLLMMANLTIFSLINYRARFIQNKKIYLLPLLCLAGSLSYGYWQIYKPALPSQEPPLKISVIQGNIPQALKWQVAARDFILGRYLNLSALASQDQPGLIIWPEAALPAAAEEEPSYYQGVMNFARGISTPLLFGTLTLRDGAYYNSAILLSAQGEHLCRYDKIHLVPFGEYIPFHRLLSFLETIVPIGEFKRGREFTVFPLQNKFSVLICFEDLFPKIARKFVQRGAGFLVNITNDAWFGKSSAPYQHLQASVLRAVENRRFLVRAANTGISGFIDPRGKIISLLADPQGEERFISAYATETICSQEKLTFYTRFGDLFLFSLFLPVAYGIINKLNLK